MSSTAAASSYWRVAGYSYLKYSNMCAEMVRSALKPAAKESAKIREAVYFRSAKWANGQAEQNVITDLTDGAAGKLG